MARLRVYWLEALATCVTVVLVGEVYLVLTHYATGPRLSVYQTSSLPYSSQAANSALH